MNNTDNGEKEESNENEKKQLIKKEKKKPKKSKNISGFASKAGKFFVKLIGNKAGAILILAIVCAISFKFVGLPFIDSLHTSKTTITSESNLTKILKTSNISTYQTVYNGIAYVYDEDDKQHKEEPIYYVSYEATVKAGVNLVDIKPSIDKEKKIITFTLPKIDLTSVSVDVGKLHIMWKDGSAEDDNVSKDAYAASVDDVTKECKNNQALKELAQKNLKNIVKGLVSPILDSEKENYKIKFKEASK